VTTEEVIRETLATEAECRQTHTQVVSGLTPTEVVSDLALTEGLNLILTGVVSDLILTEDSALIPIEGLNLILTEDLGLTRAEVVSDLILTEVHFGMIHAEEGLDLIPTEGALERRAEANLLGESPTMCPQKQIVQEIPGVLPLTKLTRLNTLTILFLTIHNTRYTTPLEEKSYLLTQVQHLIQKTTKT